MRIDIEITIEPHPRSDHVAVISSLLYPCVALMGTLLTDYPGHDYMVRIEVNTSGIEQTLSVRDN